MTAPVAVHLDTGNGPRCGNHRAVNRMTLDETRVTCGGCILRMTGRINRERRLNRIEDYLFIGGDRMTAANAAARLGVTDRTIQRYRAVLRQAGAGQYRMAS